MQPADYNVTVSKESFRTVKVSTQNVKVGSALTLDVQMEIGSAAQTIEVVAAGTELQTLNATIGNTVTAASLPALPSLNRDISTFVELQPAPAPDGSVAGAVVDQSTFMLDGGNNTNDMDGSMSVETKSFAGDPAGGLANQVFAVAAGPTGAHAHTGRQRRGVQGQHRQPNRRFQQLFGCASRGGYPPRYRRIPRQRVRVLPGQHFSGKHLG